MNDSERDPSKPPSELAFAALLERLTNELLVGGEFELSTFLAEFPEHERQVRQLLPAMRAMADLGQSASYRGGLVVAQPPQVRTANGVLGDFRIIREIGRGGMGVVYEAEQISLLRRVALKVLPLAALLDERQLARFRNEARAAGLLRHPNIVAVHCVGCERGVHFYAMDLIEGPTLANVVEAQRRSIGRRAQQSASRTDDSRSTDASNSSQAPPSDAANPTADTIRAAVSSTLSADGEQGYFRQVARIGIQAAGALEYAHACGVIHRDIKPSNLMLDAGGRLWIADFGLAQVLTDQNLTISGDVLGTLRYMSPEQAAGRRALVDPRSDVYSLGVTLYELLTLRPAYDDEDRQTLLRRLLESDPPAPRKLNPAIPRDLETIILKAVAKDRDARYETAGQLADDLQRFLDRRPIQARPTSRAEHMWRWCRRNPVVSALSAAVLLLLVALAVAGPMVAIQQAHLAYNAESTAYCALINGAYRGWFDGRLEVAADVLERYAARPEGNDFRGFEYYHLLDLYNRRLDNIIIDHGGGVRAADVSSDGQWIATAGFDEIVHVWRRTGEVWNKVRSLRHDGGVAVVRFSPDCRLLATAGEGDNLIRLWNPATDDSAPLVTLRPHAAGIYALAVSGDGKSWASGAKDGSVAVWDSIGNVRFNKREHARCVVALAFSPDGHRLASGAEEPTLCLWDVDGGMLSSRVTLFEGYLRTLGFTTHGDELYAGDRGVYVANLKTGEAAHRFRVSSTASVQGASLSRDGRLATGGYDHVVRLWDYSTGDQLATFIGHEGAILEVEFTNDGKSLIAASSDGIVRSWNVEKLNRRLNSAVADWTTPLAFSANDRTLISGQAEPFAAHAHAGALRWWNVADGTMIREVAADSRDVKRLSVSPDGTIAGCGGGEIVRRWRLDTGAALTPLNPGRTGMTWHVPGYSPDGRWLAVAGRKGPAFTAPSDITLLLFDRRDGEARSLTAPGAWDLPTSVSFSRDGRRIALGGGSWLRGSFAQVWDVETGDSVAALPSESMVWCIALSPDGQKLAAACHDGAIRVWDLSTRAPRRVMQFTAAAMSVAYSPDGKVVAACGVDRTMRLWNVEREAELAVLPLSHAPYSVAFSHDGRTLAWGGFDGSVGFLRADPSMPH